MTTSVFIFGASGDLAARLLYPALHRLESDGRLDAIRLIGVALEEMSEDQFRHHVATAIGNEARDGEIKDRFLQRFTYRRSDLSVDSLTALKPLVADVNVHYLALPPGAFAEAATAIAQSQITDRGSHRLVVEKPFGTSQATAAELDGRLHAHWDESQIFRIDHFLGKETVQNLSVMRFANRVIEPLLCAAHVDHVQITVAETLGVEGRYRYYDGIGALRDMVQNHLMQLFCLAAMDPPAVWDPDILRNHKVELLRSVKLPGGDIDDWAVRGQYSGGRIADRDVPEYRQEPGIPPDSTTDTFAAVRLQVDNWRWQGVPFYLRSGKRLGAKVSEIAYRFREPPTHLFQQTALGSAQPNWLIFRLDQPEGIDLFVQTKTPGLQMESEQSHLHADYGTTQETTSAYQQLLLDIIEGDHTPFLRVDEVALAWHLLDPVLEHWTHGEPHRYAAGSQGPGAQDAILQPGHQWRCLDT